ncbi:enoyl-CoA hydratase/isomerase family protein [Mycobacterium sp.]|uniref:enoyl-CoA hydratase/isomerase family protein n=1 Tax=Mycobacterium sp. TaxID=1785 RepID=UPI002BE31309|nr:enoyl-CoA hydratase/isomerase family protein [Mycobacterium sp.]HTQ18970.1 enoyl-CoA hydratase/isomerase family protein [Mycobacterium sp.]
MNAYQDYQCLRISAADGICRATIDHPPINLLDLDLILELGRLATEVTADEQVRVLIVDSADPDFFIAHADLKLIQMMPTDDTTLHDELSPFHAMVELFRTMPKATIAVIEGIARGGGSETALSFDMRFAALGKARLSQPEVAVGIIPGGSGTQRLPGLVGRARALEIVLGCADIDAETAAAWGYVNRALPLEELRPFVDALAARIASYPAEAVARAKRAVDTAVAAVGDPSHGLKVEDQLFRETLGLPGAAERMQALLDAGGQTRDAERGDLLALLT